jgi:adenine-specific DNA-methyltransferase
MRIHMAHIRPDVNPGMNGLLKEQPGSQLFTVFGLPRIKVRGPGRKGGVGDQKTGEPPEGEYTVEMQGMDIYDPVHNVVQPTNAGKVAAWFLDSDYDGRTFCITQAFFPDRSAWEKLAKALGGSGAVDAERFEAFSGTVSLPFPVGKHKTVAVKVIDPRGNEVMKVVGL